MSGYLTRPGMFGLVIESKEIYLAFSTQLTHVVRFMPGNRVIVAISREEPLGKSIPKAT